MDNEPEGLLRKWRAESGWTQAKLAAASGVSVATLERWENGRVTPQSGGLALVLDALKVPEADQKIAFALLDRRTDTQDRTAEDWMPGLCDLLQAMRLRRRMSLGQAAQRLGISKATLSRYESGRIAPNRERLPEIFALYHASQEERDALADRRFLIADPYANTPDSLQALELRLNALHEHLYKHIYFPGDLCFLKLEAQLSPLAKHSRRALHLLLSCWTIHAEWLLWQGRILEVAKYADRPLEIGHSYHMQAEEHQARASEMMARFVAHHPEKGEPAYALRLMGQWIDLPANKHRIATLYRDMAEMAGYAGQAERALRYIALSRHEASKNGDEGQYLLADTIESRIRIETGGAEQALAVLTQLAHPDPGQQMLVILLQAEALFAMGELNEAERGLGRFFSHIAQYDLGSNRWKGNSLAERLDAAR